MSREKYKDIRLYLSGTKYNQTALILYIFLKTYRYAYESFYELIIWMVKPLAFLGDTEIVLKNAS